VRRQPGGRVAPGGRARRVLVADDDAVSRKVSRLMLERLGCEVEVVEDGAEAVAAATGGGFDLILMDLRMPRVDGLEAATTLRSTLGAACPRIVALTGRATGEDRDRCFQAGMSGWLSKPVDPQRLKLEVLSIEPESATGPRADAADMLDTARIGVLRQVGGQRLVNDLVTLFLDEQPRRLQRLQTAVDRADATSVADVAHSIKGSCVNLGLTVMGELATRLEEMGEQSQLEGARRCIKDLEMELEAAKPKLELMRDVGPGG